MYLDEIYTVKFIIPENPIVEISSPYLLKWIA